MAKFTDQKPHIATEEDCKAPWSDGKDGKYFRLKKDAKFLYEGMLNDQISGRFYLKDDICIVCGEKDDIPISIYKLDYGFGRKIDQKIIKGLLEDLNENEKELNKIKLKKEKELPKKQEKLFQVEEEIKILTQKLELLNKKKEHLSNDIALYDQEIENNRLDKELIVKKLVMSICYKVDFLSNGNKNLR